jgi:hypothetical protein
MGFSSSRREAQAFQRTYSQRAAVGQSHAPPITLLPFPLSPDPNRGPSAPRGPSLPRLVAAPRSSLLLTSAATLDASPSISRTAVIRGALPYGHVLAGSESFPLSSPSLLRVPYSSDSEEPDGCTCPVLPRRLQPSPTCKGLGAPNNPTLCSGWGTLRSSIARPAELLAPWTDSTWGFPRPPGLLLRSFRPMSHLLRTSGITAALTGQSTPVGLSPTGTATFGAALHALVLRPRGAPRRLAFNAAYGVAFRQGVRRRRPGVVISRFNSLACTPPVNASSPPHGRLTHDSGPPWFATPSVSDSSIPGSMPVYPGAFTPSLPSPQGTRKGEGAISNVTSAPLRK